MIKEENNYLKDLEKGCNRCIKIVEDELFTCTSKELCSYCKSKIRGYEIGFSHGIEKGVKDTENKIRTKLVLLMSKHYQSNKINELREIEFIDMTSINEFCNDMYDYIKELLKFSG